MRWLNLCFIHWPIPKEELKPLIPEGLELDTFDGMAWLGLVPFEMRDVKPRFSPSVPGLSHFIEMNVRTYVTSGDKAGVWFFSLDAANKIAVRLARAGFFLPYFDSNMACQVIDETVYYQNKRTHKNVASANFIADYKPMGNSYLAKKNTLEYFLTERYCLYSQDSKGHLYRGEIHHEPWPLQEAELNMQVNDMTQLLDLTLPESKPLIHFAKELDVAAWWPEKIELS